MRKTSADSRKVAAGVLTVLVALAIPSLLYLIARWLGTGIVSESVLRSSSAFYAASLVALAIEVPRQLLRESGYIDKHVDVDLPHRATAMRYLTLIGVILVVAAYAITLMGLMDRGVWRASISRITFMITMLITAWTAHRMLRPTGGFLEPLIAKFGGSVIHRIRLIIYLLGVVFPIAMLVLSALGYGFTAGELIKRSIITVSCLLIAAPLWGSIKILADKAWRRLTGTAPPPPKFDEYGEIPQENTAGVLAEHSLELKHQLAFLFQCALVVGAIACFAWLWIDVFPLSLIHI